MKIRLLIEYDGMKFCGWQRQTSSPSVQETIENATAKVFNTQEKTEVYGAGRTDTGVHALAQVAHLDILDPDIALRWQNSCHHLPKAINAYMLDKGCIVKSAEIVPDDFHARFSATKRSYEYIIFNSPIDSPLYQFRVWHVIKKLDVELMHQVAQDFIGLHDLQSFRSSECGAKSSVKSISSISISQHENFVVMNISAKSFLHNQVRIIMGTLKNIGTKKFAPSYVKFLLDAKDRTLAGQTAPPYGLYLKSIEY